MTDDQAIRDEVLAALLAPRGHLRRRRERVARPHLRPEAHPVAGEPLVPHEVGEQPTGHAHRQHPVGEHRGVRGDPGGEDLVGVDGVVVPGCPGVHDDLGPGEVVDHDVAERLADLDLAGTERHVTPPPAR